MSSHGFSLDDYIPDSPIGLEDYSPPPSSSQKRPQSLSSSSMPLSSTTSHPAAADTIQFQLPSFLLGAPTPVAGGGADALHGSFANISDFNQWFGASSSAAAFSGHAKYDSSSSYKVPSTTASAGRPTAPFAYSVPNPMSPTSQTQLSITVPSTALNLPLPPLKVPSSTAELTGNAAPPLYSTTGFDMLDILARVASRPNPTVVLGPVDLSCSFVVVDVHRYDHPIVYASPSFFQLTGYEGAEVIGRNCRFLQAPDGSVEKGSARTYTDPAAVAHLKKCLSAGKECQANLMNYRKGGVPFLNLVSVIPISADDSDEIQYHVGFQVDLVQQPSAILQTMRDGSYLVNYSKLNHSGARPNTSRLGGGNQKKGDPANALPAPFADVMNHVRPLDTAQENGAADDQGWSDFNAMLLENSDDFIHVLSVKGILQYASPAFLRALEYTHEEIVGRPVEDIAHPQDLIPVMRELKDASVPLGGSSGSLRLQKTLHLLFRVRRKHSGVLWLESTGRLHIEPGKSRKSIVFSGRLRQLPGLTWGAVEKAGGVVRPRGPPFNESINGREFWGKLSTATGLILSAEQVVHDVLGVCREDVVGTPLAEFIEVTERQAVSDAILGCVDRDLTSYPVSINTTLQLRSNVQLAAEIVLYPPTALDTTSKSPSVSFVIIQVRIRSPSDLFPHPRTFANPISSPIYEELDFARSTNWTYEAETIRQANQKMREEIGSRMTEHGLPAPLSAVI